MDPAPKAHYLFIYYIIVHVVTYSVTDKNSEQLEINSIKK